MDVLFVVKSFCGEDYIVHEKFRTFQSAIIDCEHPEFISIEYVDKDGYSKVLADFDSSGKLIDKTEKLPIDERAK